MASGGNLVQPVGITVANGTIFVADMASGVVLQIDPITGAQAIVSSGFSQLRGIVVEPTGKILVTDAGRNAVIRIDPSLPDEGLGGNQRVVSENHVFGGLKGLSVDCDGTIYVTADTGVIRVDSVTGMQTLIVQPGNGLASPYTAEIGVDGKLIVVDPAGAPAAGQLFVLDPVTATFSTIAVDRPLLESPLDVAIVGASSRCVCEALSAAPFAEPMGKAKKLGATLPITFDLSYRGTAINSQVALDAILTTAGAPASCPEIRIYDVTTVTDGIQLPEDPALRAGDANLGLCFRPTDDGWKYNLRLNEAFRAGRTYRVEVVIGSCVVHPGNALFQTK